MCVGSAASRDGLIRADLGDEKERERERAFLFHTAKYIYISRLRQSASLAQKVMNAQIAAASFFCLTYNQSNASKSLLLQHRLAVKFYCDYGGDLLVNVVEYYVYS